MHYFVIWETKRRDKTKTAYNNNSTTLQYEQGTTNNMKIHIISARPGYRTFRRCCFYWLRHTSHTPYPKDLGSADFLKLAQNLSDGGVNLLYWFLLSDPFTWDLVNFKVSKMEYQRVYQTHDLNQFIKASESKSFGL